MSATKDNAFDATGPKFPFQKAAILPLMKSNRTQRWIRMCIPFTDCNTQLQRKLTVTNQSKRSIDFPFMLNTFTTKVPALSMSPLVPLQIDDIYQLSRAKFISKPIKIWRALQIYLKRYIHHTPLLIQTTSHQIGPCSSLQSLFFCSVCGTNELFFCRSY